MNKEIQNALCAMLTQEEIDRYSKDYLSSTEDDWGKGYEAALKSIFGKHNLTAQAEENPKAKDFPILSDSLQASEDWNSYRLNLAKEIAVAVVRSNRWDFNSCNPVEQANEIVKRLKETEE